MHLLDTQVIWALRGRGLDHGDEPLFEWIASQIPSTLFASVITIMEFENGSRLLERRDKSAGSLVRRWIETKLRPAFEGRIIAIDHAVTNRWSTLGYADFRDGILAATALEHGLVLATGSAENFRSGKVKTFNPWAYTQDSDDLDWRRASRSAPIWLKSLFVRA